MRASVAGIGAWGPGFCDWQALGECLRSDSGYDCSEADCAAPKPEVIPARERRRAPLSVRLAVEVASQACAMAGITPDQASCVFASGMGDTSITDYMCRTLADQPQLISPTRFHNSVHNAAAGYWTISTASHQAANSISGFELSVGMAVLEALLCCTLEQRPVLMVNMDIPTTDPMRDIEPIDQAFAAACVFLPESASPESDQGLFTQGVIAEVRTCAVEWPAVAGGFGPLYSSNPSARMLALLQWLQTREPSALCLPLSQATHLELQPRA